MMAIAKTFFGMEHALGAKDDAQAAAYAQQQAAGHQASLGALTPSSSGGIVSGADPANTFASTFGSPLRRPAMPSMTQGALTDPFNFQPRRDLPFKT